MSGQSLISIVPRAFFSSFLGTTALLSYGTTAVLMTVVYVDCSYVQEIQAEVYNEEVFYTKLDS
jgi:hypothetical protein